MTSDLNTDFMIMTKWKYHHYDIASGVSFVVKMTIRVCIGYDNFKCLFKKQLSGFRSSSVYF